MLRTFFTVALVVFCTVANAPLVSGNLALDFTTEIVLENAILNTTFGVTGAFTDSVAEVLQSALSASALSTRVYAVYPHLVVSSEVWYTGAVSSVETSVYTVNNTYQALVAGGSATSDISGKLSYLCTESIGQQPTLIDYTDNCSFFNEIMPPSTDSSTCLRNLSVLIYTNSSDATAMRIALCSFLPTSCDLITNATATQATVTISGSQASVYVMPFTITSQDRKATLTLLVAYANYASFLVEQKIVYILVDGVRVFYQGDLQQLWTVGTMGQCVQRMWYLIFLIILVPVLLILGQQVFYWGRRSGKRSVKAAEGDIRAGVYRRAPPWGNPGPMGYQYGPPQSYPGGYGGAEMMQQQPQQLANPFMQQNSVPQQFYSQQRGGPQQWGGPPQFGNVQQQQQQRYGGFQQQLPPGTVTNRNAQGPYNGQQPQTNANQWGGYGGGGAQAGWGQQ